MNMIERGGVAIQAAWDSGEHPAVNLPPIEFTKAEREYLFIAALKALREPKQQMMEAGDKWTNHHADCVYSIWQAMIDAALAGEGKGE